MGLKKISSCCCCCCFFTGFEVFKKKKIEIDGVDQKFQKISSYCFEVLLQLRVFCSAFDFAFKSVFAVKSVLLKTFEDA